MHRIIRGRVGKTLLIIILVPVYVVVLNGIGDQFVIEPTQEALARAAAGATQAARFSAVGLLLSLAPLALFTRFPRTATLLMMTAFGLVLTTSLIGSLIVLAGLLSVPLLTAGAGLACVSPDRGGARRSTPGSRPTE